MPNGITAMRGNVLDRIPEEDRERAAASYDVLIHVWAAWEYAWSYR